MSLQRIFAAAGAALLLLAAVTACQPAPEPARFSGRTMGTTYNVTYVTAGDPVRDARAVERFLEEINQSLSTYIETSTISRINASTDTEAWHPIDAHFQTVFLRSREIYNDTGGAFNPAVGPLVNAWGFGPESADTLPDDKAVRRLLKVVSLEAFEYRPSPAAIRKHIPEARLDFGGIAKGYGADAIGRLLEQNGVNDYLVEIAGDVRARGKRPDGHGWKVGIERPAQDALDAAEVQSVIVLENAGLSTSGNYRNYIADNGRNTSERAGHILDPRTGYPAKGSLVSASVFAPDAATSDAYATALMVMGIDEALPFVEARHGLAAYFIARDPNGGFIGQRTKRFPEAIESQSRR